MPNSVRTKTSLGSGHGTGVEIRTFMYDTRKHVKMNVSDSRKIHIIALPQGTWNVCLSADQSSLIERQAPARASAAVIVASCAMRCFSPRDQVESRSAKSPSQIKSSQCQ